MNGLVLAGTQSGVGKTVATLAVIDALQRTGRTVQPAKAGPDFIDPSHHEQVAGRRSRTLDRWLEGDGGLRRNYHRGDGDICVVEGVMGLYDGDGSSTAQVAAALDLPVVLVVDATAGMESVAATAHGFRSYAERIGRDVDVVGVIAQRAHGGRHADGIRAALPDELDYCGRIPPLSDLEIPDRHLGLHMGSEAPLDDDALSTASETLDVDRLLACASPAAPPPTNAAQSPGPNDGIRTGKRIAVARDAAFCFTYPATLERLRQRAAVTTFAPLAGDDLPPCDAVYLPGGYPEAHAAALATAPAIDQLADRARGRDAGGDGLPVFGECGGFMALCESLRTADGETHAMAGVLPAEVELCDRHQALDHVALTARGETLTAAAGDTRRGHEFHYSSADPGADARFAFDVDRGTGIDGDHDGLTEYRTLGTYCHVHPASGAVDTFVEAI